MHWVQADNAVGSMQELQDKTARRLTSLRTISDQAQLRVERSQASMAVTREFVAAIKADSGPRRDEPSSESICPILVVDDDRDITEMVAAALTLAGYKVVTACNGQEALAIIAEHPPALVLLDVHMPLLDGPGLVRQLSELGIQLPIVLMTSDCEPEHYAREIGAVAFITKPFAITQLFAELRTWCPRAA
jgi:CheY-like chemotaxis protein